MAPPRRDPGNQFNPRTIQAVQKYCYRCGTPWMREWVHCMHCGGLDCGEGAAKPVVQVGDDSITFEGPWKLLPWPRQGGVAIHGGPGAGKSTLASLLRPCAWLTSEQEPKPVGEMMRRAIPGHVCEIAPVKTPDQVAAKLEVIDHGPVVLDSLTGFGLKEALLVAILLSNWAKANNDRVLAVMQHTKGGEAAGYNEIPHLFDAICDVTPDPWGVRAFRVTKSRWSPLGSVYWTFDENGRIALPEFPAAYSVEGSGGNFWLHPFPVKGAKWQGLLAFLSDLGLLEPRSASAAVYAGYMPTGFVEPMDAHERKRFALDNGLTWLDPRDFEEVVEAERQRALQTGDDEP